MADSPSSPRDRSEESFERLWPVYGFFVAVATVLVLLLILFAPTSRFSPALERVGTGSSATVTITHVTILFTGPSNCWTSSTLSGGKVSGGHTFTLTATLSYAAKPGKPHFCTVTSVTVPTTGCLLYTSPSPRDPKTSRMPSSA